ncbi:MAG: hypothetical protein HYU60_03370 [Magnetospirillum sp.]|nr:hypothetical protein [Magnetospirillum sp.]
MSLLRYLPQAIQSWSLLWNRKGALLRTAWPAALAMLATPVVAEIGGPYGRLAAMLLTAVCLGVFGVAWVRLAGLGEEPGTPVHFRLGGREIKYGVAAKLLEGFAMVPLIVVAVLVPEVGTLPISAPLLAYGAYHLFLVLVGVLFLILPDIALREPGAPSPKLAEIILASGGLEVGVGLVFAGLPFTVPAASFDVQLPEAHSLGQALFNQALLTLPTLLAFAATWCFLAMVWVQAKAKVEARAKEASAA